MEPLQRTSEPAAPTRATDTPPRQRLAWLLRLAWALRRATGLGLMLAACAAPPAWSAGPASAKGPPPGHWKTVRYNDALGMFRQGQFPLAYGRFVALAEAGHVPSARHALWMCESGAELFGSSFDCAPHEIEAWAMLAGRDPDEALRRIYPGSAVVTTVARLRR